MPSSIALRVSASKPAVVNFAPGLTPMLGEPAHDRRIGRPRGIVRQQVGQPTEELVSRHLEHLHGHGRRRVDTRLDRHAGGRGVGRACALPLRERDQLVLVLDLVDRVIVGRPARVRAPADSDEAGIDTDHLQAGGNLALEVRAYEREVAALAAVRARAGRGRHVVPPVDDLHDPPTVALHRRHDQHDRLGAEIDIGQRIQRVHVHPDDLVVLGVGELAVIVELVERCPPTLGLGDVGLRVRLDGDVHQRQSKDVAVVGDGLGVSRCELCHRAISFAC